MEARIRRYFTFRKLGSKPLPSTVLKDELALTGVPYENNPPARAPTLSLSSRRSNAGDSFRPKDESAVMSTSRYEATVARKPPVFGKTPLKGNGPVKLQTSRRLSSGEILTTTQEHDRTLADIRDGEYIVGGKVLKRQSKPAPITTPSIQLEGVASPAPSISSAATPSTSTIRPASPPPARRAPDSQVSPSPNLQPSSLAPTRANLASSPARTRKDRPPGLEKSFLAKPSEIPLPASPASPPLSTNSLLSRGEEQNATVQALWKAEYARLVNIYGQDGVDRNIAQLNKDHFAHELDDRSSSASGFGKTSFTGSTSLTPSTDTVLAPPVSCNPRASGSHESPPMDNTSDESSEQVPSVLSEESSHTQRTSIFEAEVPTTREEVSRIVENMRKNYLTALEARSEKTAAAERRARPTQRSSYNPSTGRTYSLAVTPATQGRQSWHASTTASTSKQEKSKKPPKKRATSRPKMLRDASARSSGPSDPPSGSQAKPALQRADSTTLGSFFGVKKADRTPTPALPTRPVSRSSPHKSLTAVAWQTSTLDVDDEVSPMSSSEILAPDGDDFDIFYRDLTEDFDSFSRCTKPAIAPTIHLPHGQSISPEPHDGASPPPDIDWSPRKSSLMGMM